MNIGLSARLLTIADCAMLFYGVALQHSHQSVNRRSRKLQCFPLTDGLIPFNPETLLSKLGKPTSCLQPGAPAPGLNTSEPIQVVVGRHVDAPEDCPTLQRDFAGYPSTGQSTANRGPGAWCRGCWESAKARRTGNYRSLPKRGVL